MDLSVGASYSTVQTLQACKFISLNNGTFDIANQIPDTLNFEYIQVNNESLLQELREKAFSNAVPANSMERKLIFEREFGLHLGGKQEKLEIQYQDYSDSPVYREYMAYCQKYLVACRDLYKLKQRESLRERGKVLYCVPVPCIPSPLNFQDFESFCGRTTDDLEVIYIAPSMSHSANVSVPMVAKHTSSSDGWWKSFVAPNGPDVAVDTETYRIISAAPLGGPYGSSSPLSICSTTLRRFNAQFPIITPVDQAEAHAWLLHALGLASIRQDIPKPLEYIAGFPSLPTCWSTACDFTTLDETLTLQSIPWNTSREAKRVEFDAEPTPMVPTRLFQRLSKQKCIMGSSMGGMQVLTFCTMYPGLFERMLVTCTTYKTIPSTVALRSVQRAAIRSDQGWHDGSYAENPDHPIFRGVDLARMIGTIAYRSKDEFDARFNWNPDRFCRFDVENYLTHQAHTFTFDANCYLSLSHCMDLMDVTALTGSLTESAKNQAKSQLFILGVEQDALLPAAGMHPLAEVIGNMGGQQYYETIRSQWGHDAFQVDKNQFVPRIKAFLETDDGVLNASSIVRELQE